MKFKVTNKDSEEDTVFQQILFSLPHLFLLFLSIVALLKFTIGKYGSELFYGSIIIFWLIYNVINLLYAIFFLLGRKLYRKSERIAANEIVVLSIQGKSVKGRTLNSSEGGLLLELNQAEYIPNDYAVPLKIENARYCAEFEGTIQYVKESSESWLYGIQISSINEENKRQYSQLIYDRMHSLPVKLDVWMTAFDDMMNNLSKRIEKQRPDMRKLPRVTLNKLVEFEDGTQGTIKDFNYEYARISGLKDHENFKILTLRLDDNFFQINFEPVLEQKINKNKGRLYQIQNYKELSESPLFMKELKHWINEQKLSTQ